jgi:hypothetical protein
VEGDATCPDAIGERNRGCGSRRLGLPEPRRRFDQSLRYSLSTVALLRSAEASRLASLPRIFRMETKARGSQPEVKMRSSASSPYVAGGEIGGGSSKRKREQVGVPGAPLRPGSRNPLLCSFHSHFFQVGLVTGESFAGPSLSEPHGPDKGQMDAALPSSRPPILFEPAFSEQNPWTVSFRMLARTLALPLRIFRAETMSRSLTAGDENSGMWTRLEGGAKPALSEVERVTAGKATRPLTPSPLSPLRMERGMLNAFEPAFSEQSPLTRRYITGVEIGASGCSRLAGS